MSGLTGHVLGRSAAVRALFWGYPPPFLQGLSASGGAEAFNRRAIPPVRGSGGEVRLARGLGVPEGVAPRGGKRLGLSGREGHGRFELPIYTTKRCRLAD